MPELPVPPQQALPAALGQVTEASDAALTAPVWAMDSGELATA